MKIKLWAESFELIKILQNHWNQKKLTFESELQARRNQVIFGGHLMFFRMISLVEVLRGWTFKKMFPDYEEREFFAKLYSEHRDWLQTTENFFLGVRRLKKKHDNHPLFFQKMSLSKVLCQSWNQKLRKPAH